jgi:hypothetical protein
MQPTYIIASGYDDVLFMGFPKRRRAGAGELSATLIWLDLPSFPGSRAQPGLDVGFRGKGGSDVTGKEGRPDGGARELR